MYFPFTFKINVPGVINPFASPIQSAPNPPISESPDKSPRNQTRPIDNIPSRRSSPNPLSAAASSSRKRGWEPSFAEPSPSTTTIASTSGYLDTPAKYREMSATSNDEFHAVDETASFAAELPPPAKRRRGLGGSIVSTALSAALIGTAVGLTVYRLWRDRGKEPESEHPPPPPYQQGEWTPISTPQTVQVTPATPRSRRPRLHASSSTRRPIASLRRPRVRQHEHNHPPVFPAVKPEFDFSRAEGDGGIDDRMDWMGSKLSMLIEQGKKALGKEVVIMSDAREDEVDDDTDAWEEEDPDDKSAGRSPNSHPSSLKRTKRPRNLAIPPSYTSHPPSSASPKTSGFQFSGAGSSPIMITPRQTDGHSRSAESDFGVNASSSFRDDERTWESPELKESMEKARARFLQNQGS